ncbi:hypothetical protein [Actinacidiphila yeochonensis]|uniref:hypothetical protein n=1 Tax=Actinacidiphila yeochonensis TaxID=89050 RepID=UPI001E2AD819|nr:hypothetical protein [Actinacidiphila yeochonensis]
MSTSPSAMPCELLKERFAVWQMPASAVPEPPEEPPAEPFEPLDPFEEPPAELLVAAAG